jgi:hypothetical protein
VPDRVIVAQRLPDFPGEHEDSTAYPAKQ